VRISDADPAVLRSLAERGIGLDTLLTVEERAAPAEDVTVHVDGDQVVLGGTAAAAVWVSPTPRGA
jgi:DtxR family Mn-dependent transcriptional regulator